MRVYKRGSVYWYEFQYQNEQIRKSSRSRNLRVAEQIANTFFVSLIKGEVGIKPKKPAPKFGEAMKSFLAWSTHEHSSHPATTERYMYSSKPLLKYFGDRALDTITPEDVEAYKLKRSSSKAPQSKRKLRPATVNRELACLRKMFNQAIKGCPDLHNPVSQVKFLAEDNQQDRVLTYAEQTRYMEKTSPTLAAVAGLILETGMRPEEVFSLRPGQIDLERGSLRILRGKTKAARRQIELTDEACKILAGLMVDGGNGYLFPNERDSKRPIESVQTAHSTALRASKVAPFRPYDLRHTWATRAAEAGVDLVTLAAMLGHSRIQMVLRYAHPTQDHQANAKDKMVAHRVVQKAREKAQAEAAEERRAGTGLRIVQKKA